MCQVARRNSIKEQDLQQMITKAETHLQHPIPPLSSNSNFNRQRLAIMALIRLVLAALAVLAATADAAILDGCDDCFSPVTDLVYGDVYLDGSQYGAFSVSAL